MSEERICYLVSMDTGDPDDYGLDMDLLSGIIQEHFGNRHVSIARAVHPDQFLKKEEHNGPGNCPMCGSPKIRMQDGWECLSDHK
jgi:hypothetical protein